MADDDDACELLASFFEVVLIKSPFMADGTCELLRGCSHTACSHISAPLGHVPSRLIPPLPNFKARLGDVVATYL